MSVTGRVWHAATAAVVVVALVIQVPITAAAQDGAFDTPGARVANLFTFFTILTNLLVAGTSLAVALRPERRSTVLAVLRLDALVGIGVTAAVHHTLLAGLRELSGAEELADQLFHSVTPALAIVGWVLFGPRGTTDRRVVLLSVLYPVAWLAFTLARGAVIDWYPYPFVDVALLGYGQVALNCVGIAVLFGVLAAAVLGLDRLLGRRAAGGARIGA
ncbi:Pr6Pr family membrane protein [Pseudonocardia sp. KRD-184]|uniref:Pr6Pr family membrane protein n=1 Tax=Pseudonocardia oceani TaxID=2792013 RepID=A0ABS6UI33_9PSEU|nr:Pr6Pr family membrane protein [Pseudonocardia oceani]MBW0089813.1 Pr6Pr family membrane protein [Pseudonocardia oceani]MBW0096870.1 Pr6Pr family membrane protein [Pseudonocardia oceani]MBW0109568.1 Pr6Pr family membrane protein [Pseudonocardia oceani]MBW0123705.1 Pr6Pr family membrane protein [Pseudonocardia oceani]MBW0131922.1 Pr6Pr family membrane protein [Pseudonocardia oceani]